MVRIVAARLKKKEKGMIVTAGLKIVGTMGIVVVIRVKELVHRNR
jgi:hypothetical protein